MNCELVPRTAQLRLRTVILLYHGTAAAAAAIAAASPVIYGLQILSVFSVAVELPCRRAAITLSLPCSSSELIPLNVTTQQEHWGSDQVIFKDNKTTSVRNQAPRPVAGRFATTLRGVYSDTTQLN